MSTWAVIGVCAALILGWYLLIAGVGWLIGWADRRRRRRRGWGRRYGWGDHR